MEENHKTSQNGKPGDVSAETQQPEKPLVDISSPKNRQFTIVGMGGSAGSLDAIEQFFEDLPANSGIAFVIVQHVESAYENILPELLQRCTQMPVLPIQDGMKVAPNHVYVIPEDKDLAIMHGVLLLMEPTKPKNFRMPIDTFLQSLAEDWGEKAACIIFSGLGSDGELGARFIKEAFGLVIVQDPLTAQFDTMPRSALQTGMADFVIPPKKMGKRLIDYFSYASGEMDNEEMISERRLANAMQKIFMLLRTKTGHDFSLYKKNTLVRRFERRMHILQMTSIDQYIGFLQENPEEVETLFKELLIGVTKFFRDAAAFQVLEEKLLPDLLRKKNNNDVFRVWVAGCSTGEEAYSIAISIRECMTELKLKNTIKVQIYATDLDIEAIKRARAGIYLGNISNDIPLERLDRWFQKKDDHYQVVQDIREMVVFAEHNLIKDASFIKLDVLSCRNVLIYFTPELQKKLLPVFHYTLNPDGILFLGPSETISSHEDLFTFADIKWKLFRRRENNVSIARLLEFPAPPVSLPRITYSAVPHKQQPASNVASLSDIMKETLLEKHTPPAVIINEKGDILYINGRIGKYLEPAPGQAAMNAFDMARDGLSFELRNAVFKVVSKKESKVATEVKVKINEDHFLVRIMVAPIYKGEEIPGLLMVVFEDLPTLVKKTPKSLKSNEHEERNQLVSELEKELKLTREHLQQSLEQMQTSFEELKSTNEELQSSNEELQSTNEEANTAKEEMQALNEELMTVNAEFRAKTEELTQVNNDMVNLLNSSEVATIFLSNKLEIKRFTPTATKIVNLIHSDIGRPITHISSNLKHHELANDVREVINQLTAKEIEVEAISGQWYCMKINPYRTMDNFISGAVITFIEITAKKRLEKELEATRIFADHLVNMVRSPLLIVDNDLQIISANRGFVRMFGIPEELIKSKSIYDFAQGQWNIPQLRTLLEEVLQNHAQVEDYLIEHSFPIVGHKKVLFNIRHLIQPEVNKELILIAIDEV